MKKIGLLVALTLVVSTFFAQDEKVNYEGLEMGVPYPVVDAPSKNYFTYQDLIIAVKIDKKKFYLQTYHSNKLTLEKIKIYDDFPKGFQVEEFLEINNKVYLFYSLWDKKNKKEQLFYREINPEACSFVNSGELLLTVDGKVSGSMYSKGFYSYGTADKFDLLTSFDESKLLVQYRKYPKHKKDAINKDVIGLHVYDGDLEQLWGEEVEMPYTEAKMDNLDYTVDNEGNAYMAIRVYRDNTTKLITKEKEINYDIELLQFEAGSGEMNQTEIQLTTGKFMSSIRLFESGDDKIVVAGYYSDGGKNGKSYSGINGLFKFDLVKGEDGFNIAYYDIPMEIVNQNMRKKDVEKNKKKENKKEKAALENLTPDSYYVSADGSIVIIGEQYYVTSHTYRDSNGNTRTTYTYHYHDVLVTKINKDGSLAWMRKLAKRQSGGFPGRGLSFALVEGKKDLHLIYMDNIKNKELDNVTVPSGHRDGAGGFLTAYSLDYNSGETKKTTLMDSRNVKGMKIYQYATSRISSNNLGEFIFEVYKKGKEDVLIKITLD